MAQESVSETQMIARRNETAVQLESLHQAAQVQGAYGREDLSMANQWSQLDLVSEG